MIHTIFSPCRQYRYALFRKWFGGNGYCVFIGLNPSVADERCNDPTIRRDIGFAKRWGYGALCKLNLFAFLSTDPRWMKRQEFPIGPDNDEYLRRVCKDAGVVVAAWGTHGAHMGRGEQVRQMLTGAGIDMHVLRLNKDGSPAHPLSLPKTLTPVPWGTT